VQASLATGQVLSGAEVTLVSEALKLLLLAANMVAGEGSLAQVREGGAGAEQCHGAACYNMSRRMANPLS
jgi:hypothetical protein